MPYVEGRLLLCLCPLVNLDLFKKGHYHISSRISDCPSHVDVVPDGVKDLFGGERSGLSEYCFPGSCVIEDRFLSQTVLIEYTAQSFMFGEYFMFKVSIPIRTDYNDVYMSCQLSLTLDLMFSDGIDIPMDHTKFEKVSTRTISLNIDWRKGLHDHWPVMFDYFHLAAVGVTIHASLYNISPQMYKPQSAILTEKKVHTNKTVWPFQQSPTETSLSYDDLLFGIERTSNTKGGNNENNYVVPTKLIERAKQVHKMLSDVLIQARDNLRTGFIQMTGDVNRGHALSSAGPENDYTTMDDVKEECQIHLEALSTQLQALWEWFCYSVVTHPNMMLHLAAQSHLRRLEIHMKTFIDPTNKLLLPTMDYTDMPSIDTVAIQARKLLTSRPQMYPIENIDNCTNASVMFIEQCPWEPANPIALEPSAVQRFQTQIKPFLSNKFPTRLRMRPSDSIHLVICIHGLQGNQFDLRLYRSYLELSLPYHRLEFLMAQSNQFDTSTFTDFNLQTNRLEQEVLVKVNSMTTPPSRISFLAHSLGGIVVRSLVTRPSMINLLPKLHLLLSICGPHLGTQHHSGVISAGMWCVRKWYSSQSLLQLSLKDSPNPRDSFLYHLSEAHTLDCFKHVILLTSLQDKYVPHKSARIYPGNDLDPLSDEMASNILSNMEEAGVNLVRVIVQHSLCVTADSLIGRAAHVAMLDNEHFVEKFVLCHLAQYFLET